MYKELEHYCCKIIHLQMFHLIIMAGDRQCAFQRTVISFSRGHVDNFCTIQEQCLFNIVAYGGQLFSFWGSGCRDVTYTNELQIQKDDFFP